MGQRADRQPLPVSFAVIHGAKSRGAGADADANVNADAHDLVSLYAGRTAARGADVRAAIHDHLGANPLPSGALASRRTATVTLGAPIAVGRGTEAHRLAVRAAAGRRVERAHAPAFAPSRGTPSGSGGGGGRSSRRRLVAATLAALLLLAGAAGSGLAQQRYVIQPGDTVPGIADRFGVDPAAILESSAVADPANLTPGAIVVIPDPGQSPDDAAATAARLEGTSPFVVGAHWVQSGDTLADIAAAWGVSVATLAAFNDIANPDDIVPGQRLLIPPAPGGAGVGIPLGNATSGMSATAGANPAGAATIRAADAEAPSSSFVNGVPTHVQEHNLSCEYAAAFIATAAFGNPIPESLFLQQVPQAANPHFGYRGNIDGWWGNTDDYGVYPEALAPVLNQSGFDARVFYSQGATGELTWYLDHGWPVIVWLGLWGDTGVTFTDDGTYTLAAGDHTVVAYGYDASGVYVSDPAHGEYRSFSWDSFLSMWSVLDGMALAVAPA